MKKAIKIVFFFCFLFFSSTVFCQFSKEENEMMEIIKINGSSIEKNLFLDTQIVKNMKLVNSTTWRHLWIDKEEGDKSVKQFYDIRLKFNSKRAALKFHRKYLGLNSEFSEKIKEHQINYEGSNDFYLFKGGTEYSSMMEPYGYKVYCILYVVDNYFVKQYITCLKDIEVEHFQNFISETIQKIKIVKN